MVSKTHPVSPPGEGKSLSLGGLGVIYKVMPEDTDGALAVVEHPIEPGRHVRPHTHSREDEISYVIVGEIGIRIGDREFMAGLTLGSSSPEECTTPSGIRDPNKLGCLRS